MLSAAYADIASSCDPMEFVDQFYIAKRVCLLLPLSSSSVIFSVNILCSDFFSEPTPRLRRD